MPLYGTNLRGPINPDPWFKHINPGSGGYSPQGRSRGTQPGRDDIKGLAHQSALLRGQQRTTNKDVLINQAYGLLEGKHKGSIESFSADPETKALYDNFYNSKQNYEYNAKVNEDNLTRYTKDIDKITANGAENQPVLEKDREGRYLPIQDKQGNFVYIKTVDFAVDQHRNLGVGEDDRFLSYEESGSVPVGSYIKEQRAVLADALKGKTGYGYTKQKGQGDLGLNVQNVNGRDVIYYGSTQYAGNTNVSNVLGGKVGTKDGKKVIAVGVGGVIYESLSDAASKEVKGEYYETLQGNSTLQKNREDWYNKKKKQYLGDETRELSDNEKRDLYLDADESNFKQWLYNKANRYAKNSITSESTSKESKKVSQFLSEEFDDSNQFFDKASKREYVRHANVVATQDKNGTIHLSRSNPAVNKDGSIPRDNYGNPQYNYGISVGSPQDTEKANRRLISYRNQGLGTTVEDIFPTNAVAYNSSGMAWGLNDFKGIDAEVVKIEPLYGEFPLPGVDAETGRYTTQKSTEAKAHELAKTILNEEYAEKNQGVSLPNRNLGDYLDKGLDYADYYVGLEFTKPDKYSKPEPFPSLPAPTDAEINAKTDEIMNDDKWFDASKNERNVDLTFDNRPVGAIAVRISVPADQVKELEEKLEGLNNTKKIVNMEDQTETSVTRFSNASYYRKDPTSNKLDKRKLYKDITIFVADDNANRFDNEYTQNLINNTVKAENIISAIPK